MENRKNVKSQEIFQALFWPGACTWVVLALWIHLTVPCYLADCPQMPISGWLFLGNSIFEFICLCFGYLGNNYLSESD